MRSLPRDMAMMKINMTKSHFNLLQILIQYTYDQQLPIIESISLKSTVENSSAQLAIFTSQGHKASTQRHRLYS